MATLVSPGVAVDVIGESFFIPGRQATVPLIFVATADEKLQSDGISPALGTYEHNVIRTVTGLAQSEDLYGIPRFLTDDASQPMHGDARNEYGVDALNKFLEIGDRAFVVRANVDLDDSYANQKASWTTKVADAADVLNALVVDFIIEYNSANGLVPASVGYKQTVTASELKDLVDSAMVPVFDAFAFSSTAFQEAFIFDHTISRAGFQEVSYDTTGGNITGLDNTGLANDTTAYGFEVTVSDNGGTNSFVVSIAGQDAQNYAELISEMESAIQAVTGDAGTVVEIIAGKIRITSGLSGASSAVEITSDGSSGTTPLFLNTTLFSTIDDPINGKGAAPLSVYDDDFAVVVSTYDGMDSIIEDWVAGTVVATEFTADEAEGVLLAARSEFDNTLEFLTLTSLGANDAERRATIVTQLQGAINNPNSIFRSDRFDYNLAVTPGFWETSDELVRLAEDMDGEIFIIGDTPFNRPPTGANGMISWQDDNKVFSSSIAYYYPHGLSSNTDGAEIMTSAASSALRTFALNDRSGELWYAPAGPTRGTATHLTSIGYVSGVLGTATTWVEEDVDKGTQDTLFAVDINYYADIINRGIILMAQNTTQSTASALDRVNVARLTAFIRRTLRRRLFDFLFEPNDDLTRQNVKAAVDSFLAELAGRRGLFDFATQVDDTNNTPAVVARSELVVDIAIKPVQAVEFVLVDLRLVRTDAVIR
jgi:hypothetical protein